MKVHRQKHKNLPTEQQQFLRKARCFLRCDKQETYIYFDPYSLYAPAAHQETIRVLLEKVGAQVLIIEGGDVSNAYIYGDLDEPIVMEQSTD